MILRRYYRRGVKYGYYFHPEIKTYHELLEYADSHPDDKVLEYDNASYEMILSKEEQESYWKESIRKIMLNTRYVLDHLDDYFEFRVWWNADPYKNVKRTIGKPPEHLTKECDRLYNHI